MNCFLAFDSQDFTRFSSIDGGFYVRKFKNSKVKEVSFYSKLSLEFPEELRMYRCGDLSGLNFRIPRNFGPPHLHVSGGFEDRGLTQ